MTDHKHSGLSTRRLATCNDAEHGSYGEEKAINGRNVVLTIQLLYTRLPPIRQPPSHIGPLHSQSLHSRYIPHHRRLQGRRIWQITRVRLDPGFAILYGCRAVRRESVCHSWCSGNSSRESKSDTRGHSAARGETVARGVEHGRVRGQ